MNGIHVMDGLKKGVDYMTEQIKRYAAQIADILAECEEIQHSEESAYTKEQAKVSAYEQIKELAEVAHDEI